MIDLTADQMLGMARIAGLHIPDEDVVPLTLRLNALLEASEVLDQFPLEDVLALPTLPHPAALPVHQRDARGAPPLATERTYRRERAISGNKYLTGSETFSSPLRTHPPRQPRLSPDRPPDSAQRYAH